MSARKAKPVDSKSQADRDLIALGIAAAAIIMFLGTGSAVLPQIVRAQLEGIAGPDTVLTNALLLNIALIIFGWRRYRELRVEVQERRAAEEQARILAETDPLTGCLNRRSLNKQTDRLIATCEDGDDAIAFLMIDLDNFKTINDVNGHRAGDTVLSEITERISSILPEESLLARLGGDEFGCVVRFESDHPQVVDDLAKRIIERICKPIAHEDIALDITASIGLARSDSGRPGSDGSTDAASLMHFADIAMYHAKKHGRNRYYWFEHQMEHELRFRSQLEAGIRRGLHEDEFEPYYEQQIDVATGELVGFEMLARWNSPQLGIVNPDVFIPIAEELGVIGELSEQLIRKALDHAKEWDEDLTLSVNISPVQLRDPWFAQRLLKLMVEANFPANRLDVEITETCLHENIGLVRSLVSSLKNQGVTVSLDDFGTGYSSLAQLRSLPFDRIKIDRSFVSNLPEDQEGMKIVEAITSLGDGFGLPITAEGIENEQVLAKLRGLGNFKGQGYLYGRPEPADLIRTRLRKLDRLRKENPTFKTNVVDGAVAFRKDAGSVVKG
ncbi:hypothetical protein GCM10010923_14230 [Blastomonas marina]|uniref:GGDEF-domain containing protein n=1 Tax=Blastomonas marina TaxID=1867408 RepID=A0ABQ1FBL8_9SPHN|nr:EAL domain-containing protein [Blastomonas marina]GGA05575.1 hypothetical protein GCM10010923_14230 [Blastomonas marina]